MHEIMQMMCTYKEKRIKSKDKRKKKAINNFSWVITAKIQVQKKENKG